MEQQKPEHMEEEIEISAVSVPKKRPIPKLCFISAFFILLIALGYFLGRAAWLCASDVLAFGRPDQTVTVTITEEDTLDSVAQKLADAGLIQYPFLFRLFGKVTGAAEKIGTGHFELNTLYDYNAIMRALRPKK